MLYIVLVISFMHNEYMKVWPGGKGGGWVGGENGFIFFPLEGNYLHLRFGFFFDIMARMLVQNVLTVYSVHLRESTKSTLMYS